MASIFFGDTAFTEVCRPVSILMQGRIRPIIEFVIHLTVTRRPVYVNTIAGVRPIVVMDKNSLVACYHMVGVQVVDCQVVDAFGGGPLLDGGDLDVGAC
jgi:hypothetical protein